MIPLHLTLGATVLALAVSAQPLVLDHPDEVALTRAWIEAERARASARQAALPAPARPATPAVADLAASAEVSTEMSAEMSPATAISDPFAARLQTPLALTAPLSAPLSAPIQRQSRDEEADDHTTANATTTASPAAPMLRLLGSLEQGGQWLALLQVDGTTYRLGAGDALPSGAGRLIAIHEDRVEIVEDGQSRQLQLVPADSAASAPPRHYRQQRRERRLIRPGEPA